MRYLAGLWSRLKKKAETVKAPGLVHKEVDISLRGDARPLQRHLREPHRRRSQAAQGDPVVPRQGGAGAAPQGAPAHGGGAALRPPTASRSEIAGARAQGVAAERRLPHHRPGRGAHRDRREHRAATSARRASRRRSPRSTSRPRARSSTSCGCATSAASSSATSSTWTNAQNRDKVLATLEEELGRDRAKTNVRRALAARPHRDDPPEHPDGARGILTRACPVCQGKARVFSDETMALSVERRVRALARKSRPKRGSSRSTPASPTA